jgi:hypothetical protein
MWAVLDVFYCSTSYKCPHTHQEDIQETVYTATLILKFGSR